ncbi:MAG: hypothetical protein QXQ31_05745 [Zestosphaera sp.]
MSQIRESKPESLQNKYVRVQTVIPLDWYDKVKDYMRRMGYYSIGEFLRDLIREKLEEADGS